MFKSDKKLRDKKVAIIATHGFEFSELFEPKKALEEAGARVEILSREAGSIKSWKDNNWGESLAVDKVITDAHPSDYDAVVLPGGGINADIHSLESNQSAGHGHHELCNGADESTREPYRDGLDRSRKHGKHSDTGDVGRRGFFR